ncbi:hypothetical protein Emag_000689 [Eimeria magna]
MFFGNFPFGDDLPGHGRSRGPPKERNTTKFYDLLEVDKNASIQDCLVFLGLACSYEVLSDPEKKRIYDELGEEGLEGGGAETDPSDIFDLFFGGRRPGRQQSKKKGEDIVSTIKVTLEQIYNGAPRRMAINKDVICKNCEGRGGPPEALITCKECDGTGVKVMGFCLFPGVKNHHKIFFRGEADERPGEIPGDVVLVVEQQEHEVFKRRGNDLFMTKKITLYEALCGFKFLLTHLDGRQLLIKGKPGEVVKPDAVMCVKGEGMPNHKNPFISGELYIVFDVEFPASIPDSLHAKFAELLPQPEDTPMVDEDDPKIELHTCEFVSPEELRARQQQQRTQGSGEAYEEDDEDAHAGGAQRVQCRQQ